MNWPNMKKVSEKYFSSSTIMYPKLGTKVELKNCKMLIFVLWYLKIQQIYNRVFLIRVRVCKNTITIIANLRYRFINACCVPRLLCARGCVRELMGVSCITLYDAHTTEFYERLYNLARQLSLSISAYEHALNHRATLSANFLAMCLFLRRWL